MTNDRLQTLRALRMARGRVVIEHPLIVIKSDHRKVRPISLRRGTVRTRVAQKPNAFVRGNADTPLPPVPFHLVRTSQDYAQSFPRVNGLEKLRVSRETVGAGSHPLVLDTIPP